MSDLICAECGTPLNESNVHYFAGNAYCSECLDDLTVCCTRCGDRIFRDDACYRHDASDEPYCEDCIGCNDDESGEEIHNYYYKPTPIFHGDGNRFFGVELEIDEAGECNSYAAKILDIGNENANNIYCKHDGSLNDGFEIVTHPMTLEYHMTEMPWEAVLDKARAMGYYSHQAHTCGLHVHVNRTAFGESETEQDAAIARILFFVERNWNELLTFSRRTQRQLERWAARYGYKDNPSEILEHAKKGRVDRYTCVNITNDHTIEFRIFRGTLKYNTLIATLQMVNRICDLAIFLSDSEIRNLSWPTFVAGVTEPELIQYLKDRRLYVSEPVETEEEI
ncbi:MAG: zinc-binding protein [Ruminococcaceae bacterium]|nr:zinc-binding protein [Oscillospiraceae bacterium]